jgi:hypothetical protein
MNKQSEEAVPNPKWTELKPEEEGRTWFKLEDVMLFMGKNAYKCIEVGPPPTKEKV